MNDENIYIYLVHCNCVPKQDCGFSKNQLNIHDSLNQTSGHDMKWYYEHVWTLSCLVARLRFNGMMIPFGVSKGWKHQPIYFTVQYSAAVLKIWFAGSKVYLIHPDPSSKIPEKTSILVSFSGIDPIFLWVKCAQIVRLLLFGWYTIYIISNFPRSLDHPKLL